MLNPDYRDILCTFIDEQVEFLLVGAYALAVHGVPRATGDIDLWVRRSAENAKRIMKALAAFGAPLHNVREQGFLRPDIVLQIGVVPRRIDILTSITGVEFEDAWSKREEVEVEGVRIPVISRAHLVMNKRALGRSQDIADLERMVGGDG